MKRLMSIGIAAAVTASSAIAATPLSMKDRFEQTVANLRATGFSDVHPGALTVGQGANWRKATANSTMRKAVRTEPDGSIDSGSNWGSLYTPDDEEWFYTMNYEYDHFYNEDIDYTYSTITGADIVIYNASLEQAGRFQITLDMTQGDTGINYVAIAPTLSKKFFNINDAYEVMVYVHCTTEDYSGRDFTEVYSLTGSDTATYVETFDGNQVFALNNQLDAYSENFTMAFMRDGYDYDADGNSKYYLYYDVYKKAGYGTSAQLMHTFVIDYELFAGAGNYALPFLCNAHNNQLYYAIPYYEQPFWVYNENYYTDPDVTEDNHFIIDLYDSDFNLIHTTSIPMEGKDNALWSFPGMGQLFKYNDLSFDFYDNSDQPVYFIGYENYLTSTDDFQTDLHVFDWDGNLLATIVENATDFISMSDVEGYETQFCFYLEDEDVFRFVDVPSCETVAEIPTLIEGATYISTSIDRIAEGRTYSYVSSLNTADVDADNNALHRLAWFDKNGNFVRYEYINVGSDVTLAQVYVDQVAFDPYLFNTDSKREYLFLVKVLDDPNSSSSATSEYLRLYNEDGDILLSQGPDTETGAKLSSIYLQNAGTSLAKLMVIYYQSSTDSFYANHFALPLSRFAGGDGTSENPYHLATAGDVMQINSAPGAHYVVDCDIDFDYYVWGGNDCTFTGSIDGQGYAIENMRLTGTGLVSNMFSGASIKNLYIVDSEHTGEGGGFVAGYMGGSTSGPTRIDNVHVKNCVAESSTYQPFGAIAGSLTVYSQINDCSATGVDFNISGDSQVGGIVGEMRSSASVSNCYVTGTIAGNVVGGITGGTLSEDENIVNCHVDAAVIGGSCAGGIVGDCARSSVKFCYVEGSVEANGDSKAQAGGIAGYINTYYEGVTSKSTHIGNCIVAAESITANPDAPTSIAHRIAGSTSYDRPEIDWDHVTSDMEYADYPHLDPVVEAYFGDNYAIGLALIDGTVEDATTTTEGKTIAIEDLESHVTSTGWALGEDSSNPWKVLAEGMALYYEDAVNDFSGIVSAVAPANKAITFDGTTIKAEGQFAVYNTSGMLVLKGNGEANASQLGKGIYIVAAANSTLKIVIR
ncbi:MAG: T9SS type A sorting domain-containing protein [Bacteroidales bacterium]|nr:T9SS type A sorting domain-containing protein [Bacteroidales bacterium]